MKGFALLLILVISIGCQSHSSDTAALDNWGTSTLVEELKIGEADGEDDYLFGWIEHITVDGEGSIYVADLQLKNIRKYSSRGQYLLDIGRAGEGPGEYGQVLGICALPDGSLAVLHAPHRITLYSSNGKYLRDWPVASTLHSSRMLECDLDSNLYVLSTNGMPISVSAWEFCLLKYSKTGELVGRVTLPREDPSIESFTLIFPEGPLSSFPVMTCSAWSPFGYLLSGRNDEYAIKGKSGMIIGQPAERVELTSGEKREWQAWATFFAKDGSSCTIPHLKPFFRSIDVAVDGRIVVNRYTQSDKRQVPERDSGDSRPLLHWRETTTFDLYEPDGHFVGSVVAPARAQIHTWKGQYAWGILMGEESPFVVRWRIEPRDREDRAL